MPDLHVRLTEEDEETLPDERSVLDEASALAMLASAEFVAEKLVPWGSNYTFAVGLAMGEEAEHIGIYKPVAGERPLWDFPIDTLYLREYASYLLSDWFGWGIVPPTVVRDGPHGPGSLQLYIEPTTEPVDERTFWGRKTLEIERIVMFDYLSNNADRKIGHCLVDVDGRLWGIDHGLTFNVDPKLRTVLWQYSGGPISEPLMLDLAQLDAESASISELLGGVLDESEIEALLERGAEMLETGEYPVLDPRYNVPYGWW